MSLITKLRTAASVPNPPSGHAEVFVDAGILKAKLSTGDVVVVGPVESSGGGDLVWSATEVVGNPATLVVGEIMRFEAGTVASIVFPVGASHGDRVGLFCTGGTGSNNGNLYAAAGECFEDYETHELNFDTIDVVSPSSSHIRAKHVYLEYRFDAESYDSPTWRLVDKEVVHVAKGFVVLQGTNGALLSDKGGIVFSASRLGAGSYSIQLQDLPPNVDPFGLAVAVGCGMTGAAPARHATYAVTNGGGGQYTVSVKTWDAAGVAADVDVLSLQISA